LRNSESITDPNKRAAWLEGDWDIVAGGAIDDVWRKHIHILPRFAPPGLAHRSRARLGESHPASSWGWFAESNGEEATIEFDDGSTYSLRFARRLVRLSKSAKYTLPKRSVRTRGFAKAPRRLRSTFIDYEIALMRDGWIENQPWPGPADNQIRDVRESDVDTIEKKMADKGVRWERSDKSPGSRKIGLQLMRDMLEAAMKGDESAPPVFHEQLSRVDRNSAHIAARRRRAWTTLIPKPKIILTIWFVIAY
jgi:hypothetical protein